MTLRDIGYSQALSLTLDRTTPSKTATVPVWEASGLVLAEDVVARVDCPSLTASAKDGFAVRSSDVARACEDRLAVLALGGRVVAGESTGHANVVEGFAVEVMTGAPLPSGADAVVSAEFATIRRGQVFISRDAAPGRNVLRRGSDVAEGQELMRAGNVITPAMSGLMAAGGVREVSVHPRPRVGLLATGDEVVTPGEPIRPGQLYASNLVTLRSWLSEFNIESWSARAPDDAAAIRKELAVMLPSVDVVLTSGGAWKSERDVTPAVVEELGGELLYHRVRLAPGKAAAMAMLGEKIVFCLPGGPPSNEMAFLQLVLPGLRSLSGHGPSPFRTVTGRLAASVYGGHGDPTWTKFFQATVAIEDEQVLATPLVSGSRLVCQAQTEALIKVPEGIVGLDEGSEAEIQLFGDF